MKTYISLLISFLICSCSTPAFYKEVKSTFPERSKNETTLYFKNNSDKEIFQKLSGKLKNTNRIIYHFSPNGTNLSGNGFSAVVIDVDNSKYYLLTREDKKEIILKETTNQIDNDYHKFVIENFKKGKINYLQELGSRTFHSGINTTDGIYEIDLANKQKDRYIFKTLFFINGKPSVREK